MYGGLRSDLSISTPVTCHLQHDTPHYPCVIGYNRRSCLPAYPILLYTPIHSYTLLYTTLLYTPIHSYILLYTPIHSYHSCQPHIPQTAGTPLLLLLHVHPTVYLASCSCQLYTVCTCIQGWGGVARPGVIQLGQVTCIQ